MPWIRQKYHLEEREREALVALIALCGELVVPQRKIKVCRDPADDMFIEAALAGAVEQVVTGGKDLLTLKTFETVHFVTPRTFLSGLRLQ